MSPDIEQHRSACHMLSALTNLDVQVFDAAKALQIYVAHYELPAALERLRQEALLQVLKQPVSRGQVLVARDAIHLAFFAAGIWHGDAYQGTIIVGPAISKVFHPQVLRAVNQNEPISLTTQKQLQQSYNALPLVDETKQQAIGFCLTNLFAPGMHQPQLIEVAFPVSEDFSRLFTGDLEQNWELIARRYENENRLLHAITTGNARLLKEALEGVKETSRPMRHPASPVRSLKNLALVGNTLCRKAAEQGGVHPLILDSVSGKFAIQIEQAQSLAELYSSNDEIQQTYCDLVREASVGAFPPVVRDALTFLRLHLDQPFNLDALARTLRVSSSHLSRICKKALGMTLTNYLTHLRIEEAKYRLDHSHDPMAEIASAVGFYDATYFSKVFRQKEGITPRDYRQRKKTAPGTIFGS